MKSLQIFLPLVLALLWTIPATADELLREQLRQRLEILGEPGELVAGGQMLYAVAPLQALYTRRGWKPLWFGEAGEQAVSLDEVIGAIDLAFAHGLDAEHYHRRRLVELLGQLEEAGGAGIDRGLRIDIELLASDALLTVADHLAHGRIDPETIDPEWFMPHEPTLLLDRLAEAARGESLGIRQILETLLPTHADYRALVERLALQRRMAAMDGWSTIEIGPLLRPGESDPRVDMIRQRLAYLGDFDDETDPDGAESAARHDDRYDERYDTILEQAVIRFQLRHGLNPDGVIGPRTLAALNTLPEARIDQLRANLERWRWLPRSLGDEYIIVNIAGFTMEVVNRGETVMQQRVVVGTPYRRTPVFTGQMTYLVLNPSWEVPHKLAAQDQLPKIREDLDYLAQMGFTLLQGWGVNEQRIDPAEVDWSALSARNFPFRLRQAPGPKNALGRVKFMFPNPYSVYLHDTPSRGLFSGENRALSSGCIRLEQPDRLTQWLLSERSSIMAPQRINAIVESGSETTVPLNRPLTVHLLYWTAWVDDNGAVQYRDDIYQRDRRLLEALDSDAPRAVRLAAPLYP